MLNYSICVLLSIATFAAGYITGWIVRDEQISEEHEE